MLRRLESITYTLFLFLTPLLVTSFSRELFEFPKTNFLYLITGLLLFVAGYKLKLKLKTKEPKLFTYSVIAILLANLISFLFSIDHYTSLFGYYTRFNGGVASIFCLVIWIIFLTNLQISKENIEQSIFLLLITGIIISAYAILQKFGIDKNLWNDDPTKRVFSTLGQPNWLAAYLIPIFYIAIYFGSKLKTNILFKLIPAIVIYIAIILTYSISGFLAFLVSVGIFSLLNIKSIKKYLKKYWHSITIIFFLSLILAIPLRDRINSQVENMYGIIGLLETDKASSLPVNYGDTGKIRLILWDGTLKLITSSPKQFLIGSGPETFAYAFPKFRPDSMNATSEATFVHNKPHNWFLEIFANLGLLGFIVYLGFIFLIIYLFIKSEKTLLSKSLFTGWLSILITNFFGWPTLSLSILFFILPVFLNFDLFTDKKLKEIDMDISGQIKLFLVFVIANFLIFTAIIFSVADYYYKTGRYDIAHRLNPFEARYELFQITYSSKLDTNNFRSFYYRNATNPYVVKTLINYLDQLSKRENTPQAILNLRREIISDARKNSPNDLQFIN